jgi:hypothetical protein
MKSPEPILSESDIATIDALKTLVDIMLSAGVAPPSVFDEALAHQRDGHLQNGRQKTAGMLEVLRQFATDPQREASRQQIRQALRSRPKGQA